MKNIITSIVAALTTFVVSAATTETYNLAGPVNQPLIIPAAKAGLVRVDFLTTIVVNGILTVNNQSAVAQPASVSLTLAYSAPPFGNASQFGAWRTWPLGVTSTSGFGFTDIHNMYYTSNLSIWQNPAAFTVNATATAGGTLPTGFSASGAVDPSSNVKVTLVYTYDSIPPAQKKKRK